jgi:hypothetical protein
MTARRVLLAICVLTVSDIDVQALTPPSDSDGPVKLLTCLVSPQGVLEAEVSSQSDDAMDCFIRCNYEFGDRLLSQGFHATIPARFQGRVSGADTSAAKAGNYSGEISGCKKNPQ